MESPPRLLDQMREVLRLTHRSDRTAEADVSWARRFMMFRDYWANPVAKEAAWGRPGGRRCPGEAVEWRGLYGATAVLPPRPIWVMAAQPRCPLARARDLRVTRHARSAWLACPRLCPPRGWQPPAHSSQRCAPQMTPQHVLVGTPGHDGARSGATSPGARLLHRPYEVSQEYACSPPGHNAMHGEASWDTSQRLSPQPHHVAGRVLVPLAYPPTARTAVPTLRQRLLLARAHRQHSPGSCTRGEAR